MYIKNEDHYNQLLLTLKKEVNMAKKKKAKKKIKKKKKTHKQKSKARDR